MLTLVQIDFPYQGPWGDDMSQAMTGLAQSIAQEPGLIWKIWKEDQARSRSGGIYLFKDRASAEAYLTMHTARLQSFGIKDIDAKLFDVNESLSVIDRAPLR